MPLTKEAKIGLVVAPISLLALFTLLVVYHMTRHLMCSILSCCTGKTQKEAFFDIEMCRKQKEVEVDDDDDEEEEAEEYRGHQPVPTMDISECPQTEQTIVEDRSAHAKWECSTEDCHKL